ncbi:hypothetical protein GGR97_001927 [Wenyingzhuangia aestuarii]|nr:hypothetical protein [Wenyingzhuangia aestuarii]
MLILPILLVGLIVLQKKDENPVFTFSKGFAKGFMQCLFILMGFLMLLSLFK